jgi:hypothetical protein
VRDISPLLRCSKVPFLAVCINLAQLSSRRIGEMSDERGRNDIDTFASRCHVGRCGVRHRDRRTALQTFDYLDGYVLIARQTELLSKQL